MKGMIIRAVPFMRSSRSFLKWTREELKQMNQITRKLMTMINALDPRDDIGRLCVKKRSKSTC